MTARLHLPHPHIAERVAAAFERALHSGLHDHADPPPPRVVPPANDWDEWHWDKDGGKW